MTVLNNRRSRKELREKLALEPFRRATYSFYRYGRVENPSAWRDDLYRRWERLGILGRVYVAKEGINAQLSVPEQHLKTFLSDLQSDAFLAGLRLNRALEDDGKSFFALHIKERPALVADGLEPESIDFSRVGPRLDAESFHRAMETPGTVILDMRNAYESEIGRFENALRLHAHTFSEALPEALQVLENQRQSGPLGQVLLYCTGGIRCEKASAFLRGQGIEDVAQLDGGIIQYVRDVRARGMDNRFRGRNFVFDARMTERISQEVLAVCSQCGDAWDEPGNCAYDPCHRLFLQCPNCREKWDGCCQEACRISLNG